MRKERRVGVSNEWNTSNITPLSAPQTSHPLPTLRCTLTLAALMYALHSQRLCYSRGNPPPPPPFPHFQCCGLGFVYLGHRQSEHDRILKVFQQPPPISLFVSRQFLSSPSRFMLLHLCPLADFWFELAKMSVLTHGLRMKLYCGDLINVQYVCPDQPLAFSNLFVK